MRGMLRHSGDGPWSYILCPISLPPISHSPYLFLRITEGRDNIYRLIDLIVAKALEARNPPPPLPSCGTAPAAAFVSKKKLGRGRASDGNPESRCSFCSLQVIGGAATHPGHCQRCAVRQKRHIFCDVHGDTAPPYANVCTRLAFCFCVACDGRTDTTNPRAPGSLPRGLGDGTDDGGWWMVCVTGCNGFITGA